MSSVASQGKARGQLWTGTAWIDAPGDATNGAKVQGAVTVSNFPATQPVSLATAPTTPVTGTFWQATQPVSLASAPTTAVTGPLTDTQLRATAVPVSGTFFQGTQPVSIATMPSTPVTGPLTDTQLRASAVPVSNSSLPLPTGAATETTLGNVAKDATLTGGTQKSINRGAAKGTTTAGDVTSTAVDANTQAMDVSVKGTTPVSLATAPTTPVTGTFWQATQPVSLATAPTTPVTGTFWQATQPVSIATNTPDVTDRAARVLGVVSQTPNNLVVTATAATGVAATATLAAVAGQFHYITLIEIQLYATAARTGGATPVLVTTTNINTNPVWDFDTAQAIGATIRQSSQYIPPLKSQTVNTITTVAAPIATTGIWRINIYYYVAA